MKDIYRELMRRSFEDAASIARTMEDESDIQVPAEAYPQMALHLYQHRVEQNRKAVMEAEIEAQEGEGTPDRGRY